MILRRVDGQSGLGDFRNLCLGCKRPTQNALETIETMLFHSECPIRLGMSASALQHCPRKRTFSSARNMHAAYAAMSNAFGSSMSIVAAPLILPVLHPVLTATLLPRLDTMLLLLLFFEFLHLGTWHVALLSLVFAVVPCANQYPQTVFLAPRHLTRFCEIDLSLITSSGQFFDHLSTCNTCLRF